MQSLMRRHSREFPASMKTNVSAAIYVRWCVRWMGASRWSEWTRMLRRNPGSNEWRILQIQRGSATDGTAHSERNGGHGRKNVRRGYFGRGRNDSGSAHGDRGGASAHGHRRDGNVAAARWN